MADGINPAQLDGINTSINTQGENIVNATNNINKAIEGLHEISKNNNNDELAEAIRSLPPEFKKTFDQLQKVLTGIQKSLDQNKPGGSQSDKKEGADIWEKPGQKDPKDSDVAKLPAKFASAGLMLNKTMMDLFTKPDSPFFTSLKDVLGKNQAAGQETKPEKEQKGGGKGPGAGLAIAGAGIGGLGIMAMAISLFAKNAGQTAKAPWKPGLLGLRLATKYVQEACKMIQTVTDPKSPHRIDLGKSKRFLKFNEELLVSLTALKATEKIATTSIPYALIGRLGLLLSGKFIENAIKLMNLILDKSKGLQLKTIITKITEMRQILGDIKSMAISATLMIVFGLTGMMGLMLAKLFLNQAIKMMNDLEKLSTQRDFSRITIAIAEMKKIFKELFVLSLYCTLLLMTSLTAIAGLFLAEVFLNMSIKVLNRMAKLDIKDIQGAGQKFKELRTVFFQLLLAEIFVIICGMLALPAIVALIPVGIFMLAVALLGKLALMLLPNVESFKIFVISVAIAMLLFAITFILLSKVILTKQFFANVFIMLLLVSVTILLFAALGLLAGWVAPFVAMFAISAILIGIALIFFWVAMKILNNIDISKDTIEKVKLIGQFYIEFASYWKSFLVGVFAGLYFFLASVLLLVGSLMFAIALLVLSFAAGILLSLIDYNDIFKAAADKAGYKKKGFIGVLLLIGAFFFGFGALTITLLFALPGIIILAVASILLLVSFISLAIALLLACFVAGILLGNWEPLFGGLMLLIPLFLELTLIGVFALLFIPLAVPLLLASVLLMAIFVPLTVAMLLAKALSKIILTKDELKGVRESIESLFAVPSLKLAIMATLLLIKAAPILAAAVMILGIMLALMGAYAAINKLKELQGKVDPKPVFDAVKELMGIAEQAATISKTMGLRAALAFKLTLGSIIDAINSIVDIIIKLAYFDSSDGRELIAKGTDSLNYVISQVFGIPMGQYDAGPASILSIFEQMPKKFSKDKLRAAQALAPLTEAISNITDVIIKLKDIDKSQTTKAIESLDEIKDFIGKLAVFAAALGGDQGVIGAVGSFLFGSKSDKIGDAAKQIEALFPIVDKLVEINDKVKDISGISEGAKNVLDMKNFVDELVVFAEKFKKGFFGGGIEQDIKNAVLTMGQMKTLIESLEILNSSIQKIQDAANSKIILTELSNLTNIIVGISEVLKSHKEAVNVSVKASQDMTKISSELVKIANNISQMQSFKTNLEENIVKPLLELDIPAQRLDSVAKAVRTLNSELTKLARENKDTLKQVGQLGNANSGGILGAVGNVVRTVTGAAPAGGSGGGASPADISAIRASLKNIENKLTKSVSSWNRSQNPMPVVIAGSA